MIFFLARFFFFILIFSLKYMYFFMKLVIQIQRVLYGLQPFQTNGVSITLKRRDWLPIVSTKSPQK